MFEYLRRLIGPDSKPKNNVNEARSFNEMLEFSNAVDSTMLNLVTTELGEVKDFFGKNPRTIYVRRFKELERWNVLDVKKVEGNERICFLDFGGTDFFGYEPTYPTGVSHKSGKIQDWGYNFALCHGEGVLWEDLFLDPLTMSRKFPSIIGKAVEEGLDLKLLSVRSDFRNADLRRLK